MACQKTINDALMNDTDPDCSCLKTCDKLPFNDTTAHCGKMAYEKCWNFSPCDNDDDNNDYCVWYCMNYIIDVDCSPTKPYQFNDCEKDCGKKFMAADPKDPDTVSYADCMYDCRPPPLRS
jgi:hypothetical protein